MKRIRLFFINYFGFSKVEANASIILLLLILIFAIGPRLYLKNLRKVAPGIKTDSTSLAEWHKEIQESLVLKEKVKEAPLHRFQFNPNTASTKELIDLGFAPYIAERIEKYRNAGGKFNEASDLKKIYGINESLVEELGKYITIPKRLPEAKSVSVVANSKTKLTIEAEEDVKKEMIPLNKASEELLQTIPGIGPYYARNIVKYRNQLGGYASFDQLSEVYRIRPEAIQAIMDNTEIKQEPVRTIPINSDSIKHLSKHPYLSWNHARAIYNYKEQHGDFQRTEEIKAIKIIDDSLYQKISPYLSVEP